MWSFLKSIFLKDNSSDEVISLQYSKIMDEWKKIKAGNFDKALIKYPSKHLLGNDKEWGEMVEKQLDYTERLNDISWTEIKGRYNFSEEDWKKIKRQLTIDIMSGR